MKLFNEMIVKTLPLIPKPIVHIFAGKYIAGPELEDAVEVTQDFAKIGGMTTVDVLGEFVEIRERALHEKDQCLQVLEAIERYDLPTYLSVKPTSIGLGLDFDFAFENAKEIATSAAEKNIFMRLDMENSPYTTITLDLFRKLRAEGFDQIGIVIQAYLRRSFEDILSVAELKPSVRLCKGIYNEDREIAFKDPFEIQFNYRKLLRLLFEKDMYPGIATHDEVLIRDAMEFIGKESIAPKDYEFQMLLGVRTDRRDEILSDGHKMRIYVPFGRDWYGYSVRRLKENPQMAGHIFKSIFTEMSYDESKL